MSDFYVTRSAILFHGCNAEMNEMMRQLGRGHCLGGWWKANPQPLPPSPRAQRSNPESFRGAILDCFAALAM